VWSATPSTSFTLDFYHIEIDDRLGLLSNTITAAQIPILQAAGIPNANLLLGSNANFFVNGFDSEIEGVDLAASTSFAMGAGSVGVDFRLNHNQQTVTSVRQNTINASRVYDLENQTPENRALLSFDYSSGGIFGGLVRLNYFDSWSTTAGLFSPGDASDQYKYGDTVLVDVEARFTLAENYTIAIGGENVFDEFPDEEQDPTSRFLGVHYGLTSPYGFNGGFYYVRLAMEF
jgi:iron complex outermembrane receptor protein